MKYKTISIWAPLRYANVGDDVNAGDLISAVGMTGTATGNHLHFEIRKNGTTIIPLNFIYK